MFSLSLVSDCYWTRELDYSRSDQSSPSSPSCSSSSLCSHRVTMETSAHAIVIAKKPRPHRPCASSSSRFTFSALMFVDLVCTVHVGHLCRHMLTIWVTKFLQCTAHGRFDSQVPPFGAYGGGPGQRKIRARKFSVYQCKGNLSGSYYTFLWRLIVTL